MTEKPTIHVAVGMILRPDGQLLLGNRPDDKPWAGWWELPGGKIEAGETVLEALTRELNEELGITITQAAPWVDYLHEYPKNFVRLSFCKVTRWQGEESGREGQKLAWINPHAPISVGPVLPATEPPLRWLQLPSRYLISQIGDSANLTPWLTRLDAALRSGIALVQFREPAWEAAASNDHEKQALKAALQQTVALCHKHKAKCLINSVHSSSWWPLADGVHLRAADAKHLASQVHAPLLADTPHADPIVGVSKTALVAVSAHDQSDIDAAIALNASFVVIGHVLPTPSHPEQPPLGWERFTELAQAAGRPAYAIGGQSDRTLRRAQQASAHGIAGIRQLVPSS
ncbi:Nudix family hydrolase [Paenalcaligenes niemegkensis]|uniref:Nudix family hydrolase n=1 Tax=Paenalcaligenes niemegkensis TaxID=2895469 RepID=UPI002151FDE9|nr:Nudix family hydrolase [Paenalcaligenes niemegkensis]MCQ9615518.1 Nudix family hydrolase [Paenalcaligenes niemegkensis]